jgi:hypothetical protein
MINHHRHDQDALGHIQRFDPRSGLGAHCAKSRRRCYVILQEHRLSPALATLVKALPCYRPNNVRHLQKQRFAGIGRGLSQTWWVAKINHPQCRQVASMIFLISSKSPGDCSSKPSPGADASASPWQGEDEGEGRRFISKGILRPSRTVFAAW